MEPWDTKQAGQFLKRSPAAVRNMVLRRIIPHRKVAGRLIFIRKELEEWVRRSPGVSIKDLEQKGGDTHDKSDLSYRQFRR